MADLIFNIAKGRHGHLATLPATNDALIAIPLQTSGLASDATMRDYATVAAILAGGSSEQTTMGRKTLTGVTSAANNTSDTWVVDADNVIWTAATGNAVSKLVVCYDPDTTGGTDADLIPLYAFDFVVPPAGGDITAAFNASGLATSS